MPRDRSSTSARMMAYCTTRGDRGAPLVEHVVGDLATGEVGGVGQRGEHADEREPAGEPPARDRRAPSRAVGFALAHAGHRTTRRRGGCRTNRPARPATIVADGSSASQATAASAARRSIRSCAAAAGAAAGRRSLPLAVCWGCAGRGGWPPAGGVYAFSVGLRLSTSCPPRASGRTRSSMPPTARCSARFPPSRTGRWCRSRADQPLGAEGDGGDRGQALLRPRRRRPRGHRPRSVGGHPARARWCRAARRSRSSWSGT